MLQRIFEPFISHFASGTRSRLPARRFLLDEISLKFFHMHHKSTNQTSRIHPIYRSHIKKFYGRKNDKAKSQAQASVNDLKASTCALIARSVGSRSPLDAP